MGTLHLVATPIGNLEDMSPRAVRALREARLIAAEDTRVTQKLLTHFDIHTPLTSYYEHNKLTKMDLILSFLAEGDVALVSDAGTPTINDPGYELVKAVLAAGHTTAPVPGPSAPMAALSASGLPADAFLYLGYLPRRSSERLQALESVSRLPYTLIWLEAPHRLCEALADIETVLGERPLAVARELTKVHEQIWRGTISGARGYFAENEPRGEFTLVIGGMPRIEKPKWTGERLLIAIKFGLKFGELPSALAKRLAEESGWDRQDVYKEIVKHKE